MHNVNSPRADDDAVEQEIQAKGLTAPRVTPADIEAAIAEEFYFTAADGVDGHAIAALRSADPAVELTMTPQAEDPDLSKTNLGPLRYLTFCVLVMRNGFTVVGKSACASPENFDAALGRKIARADAVNQVWPLLGYELRSKLAEGAP